MQKRPVVAITQLPTRRGRLPLHSAFRTLLIFALTGKAPRVRVMAGALLGFAGIALVFAPQMEGQDWTGGTTIGLALCVTGTLSI